MPYRHIKYRGDCRDAFRASAGYDAEYRRPPKYRDTTGSGIKRSGTPRGGVPYKLD